MAKKSGVWIDYKALAKVCAPVVRPEIESRAKRAVAAIRADVPEDVPVDYMMTENHSGMPVAIVSIRHPSGLARQAKHGTVTRGAAAAGLDVRRRAVE